MIMLEPKPLFQKTKKKFLDFFKISSEEKISQAKLKNYVISTEQLSILSKQLSAMLKAGVPLANVLETISMEAKNTYMMTILEKVREEILKGYPFSDALKLFPKAFPSLFASMVQAGEASGSLVEMTEDLSDYFERLNGLMKKVKSALIYPSTIIGLAITLVAALMIFVVPTFTQMFMDMGAELPMPTQWLIFISSQLKSSAIFIVLGLIGLAWGIRRSMQISSIRVIFDIFLSRVPILGMLLKKTHLARFCRTYCVLIRNGVPILKTLEICQNLSQNFFLMRSCQALIDGVSKGEPMSSIISRDTYFPSIVLNMVRSGEQSGNIEEMVRNVAVLFENDVNNLVGSLTSLIEPLLIVFLGVVVGFIVVAMFLPIFNLSSVASGI